MERGKAQRWIGGILTLGIMVLIFCMSAQNGETSSDTSGGVVVFFLRLFVPGFDALSEAGKEAMVDKYQFLIRKAAHFSVFLSLGLSCAVTTLTIPGRKLSVRLGLAALTGLVYAISDEIHQRFVPGRAGTITDVLIDFSGVVTGLLFLRLAIFLWDRRKCKKLTLQG